MTFESLYGSVFANEEAADNALMAARTAARRHSDTDAIVHAMQAVVLQLRANRIQLDLKRNLPGV